MKFRFVDLCKEQNLGLDSEVCGKSVSELFNDPEYNYVAVMVNQCQIEYLVSILMESIYDIQKVSVWVKCNPTSSDLFYASRAHKNCCDFVFWLCTGGAKYPKNIPLNVYIEKVKDWVAPEWLLSTINMFIDENVSCETLNCNVIVENTDKRRKLF